MTVLDSFQLHLRAEGKAPTTIRTYTDAAAKLAREQDIDLLTVTRRDVEKHVVSLLERYSPGYASNQFRALQRFFAWLSEEEDLPNPMAGLKGPQAEPKVVPVFGDGEVDAMLRQCRGRSRKARRDTAILMLFRDTGVRLAELAGLNLDDVDLRQREALVTGKGNRQRWVKFGSKTALAVDRYLRVRGDRNLLGRPEKVPTDSLFGMTPNGIYQMVKRRGAQAGMRVHPHQFRHSFAHTWLDRGGAEGDLMQLAGWRSAQMLRRYGASAAASRARRSYDRVMGE
jgi:integrase/recombinase XerD